MARRVGQVFSIALLVLHVGGCSSDEEKAEKQKECETIANDLRIAAVARGIPTLGACTNPSAPELRDDCESAEGVQCRGRTALAASAT